MDSLPPPWTIAYWSGLPFRYPGDHPDPEIQPKAPEVPAGTSPVAQPVKNLPALEESWVGFLGQEDPLEKEMATQTNILVWEIP